MKFNKILTLSAFAMMAVALLNSCEPKDEFKGNEDGVPQKLYINETSGSDDFVEIYNGSDKDIDISGYIINDAPTYDDEAYTFPKGSVIKAGGFISVHKDVDFTFGISGSGDNLYFMTSDNQEIDYMPLPAEVDGMESYGRQTDGSSKLVWFENSTPGKSNTSTPDENPEEDKDPEGGATATGALVINEASNEDDFVEIYNTSDKEISLEGYILSDAKGLESDERYTFGADEKIAANGFVLLRKDENATDGDSGFDFGLGGGDAVQLFSKEEEMVASLQFPDEKYDSYGCVEDGKIDNVADLGTATPGESNNGEGTEEPEELSFSVVVNEVNSKGEPEDWFELYNTSSEDFDLTGYTVTDDLEDLSEAVTFAEGTVIKAGEFMVFEKDAEGSFQFGLKDGDILYILKDGEVISETPEISKDADEDGLSWGRETDGSSSWVVFTNPTKGASNSDGGAVVVPELIGKLMINEVYTFGDQSSEETLDWIELYNSSDEDISLEGLLMWEAGGSEEAWSFPKGSKIEAKGRFVVVADKYAILNDPTNCPAWGLSKGPDEEITLAMADMNVIDEVKVPSMNENESYGRITDGATEFQIFAMQTKGEANTGDARPEFVNTLGIYVNEVYHDNSDEVPGEHNWDTDRDFIELYNGTDEDVDISGWEMTDDKHEDVFVIPAGTILKSKGFVVFEAQLKDTPDENCFPFGLGKGGDWVFLYNKPGLEYANTVDQIEVPSFKEDGPFGEIIDQGCTFGRKTDGGDEWVAFAEASKGESNNGKEVK